MKVIALLALGFLVAVNSLASADKIETVSGYTQVVGSSTNAQTVLKADEKVSHLPCKTGLGDNLRMIPSSTFIELQGSWTQPLSRFKKKLAKCLEVSKITVVKMPSGRAPLQGLVKQSGNKSTLHLIDGTVLTLAKLPEGMISKLGKPLLVDTDPPFEKTKTDATKQNYRITVWIEEADLTKK